MASLVSTSESALIRNLTRNWVQHTRSRRQLYMTLPIQATCGRFSDPLRCTETLSFVNSICRLDIHRLLATTTTSSTPSAVPRSCSLKRGVVDTRHVLRPIVTPPASWLGIRRNLSRSHLDGHILWYHERANVSSVVHCPWSKAHAYCYCRFFYFAQ